MKAIQLRTADQPEGAADAPPEDLDDRVRRVQRRLALPVILAAAASVPAVFLTLAGDGATRLVGVGLNWASLAVLTAESVLLFVLSGDRLAWLWRHKWTLLITAIAIPAVIFAVAPVQVLRLAHWFLRFFGALRVLRANRIIKAGRVLARRIGWDGRWRYLPILAGSLVAAAFVALILADPTSTVRNLIAKIDGWLGVVAVLVAGAILAAATFVVVRFRRREAKSATELPDS